MTGYTAEYVRIHFPCPPDLYGSTVSVNVTGVSSEGEAVGVVAPESTAS
jgi:hypothetical protein